MASLGGQEISSNNEQAENTTKRAESREGSAERKAATNKNSHALNNATPPMEHTNSSTLHWFAQVGGEDESSLQVSKDRDEKLRYARERQNEERQRKIEELRAQAEAAQRYREQKEEERRRRIEEIRQRDSEKRHQVEERKKAIMEAEKERREYILKKNQERDSRIEVRRRDKNSIGFAFGSSTPRLLEPADFGMVSPSTFWGQRRSTSISNVAGASLSRRSSERELADSGVKKRATSASGTDRHDDHRRKSSSMYEVFNWGYSNDEPPKRFSLSIAASEINIDGPPNAPSMAANNTTNYSQTTTTTNSAHRPTSYNNNNTNRKEDNVDMSPIIFRSVARRKTDLMPTIPSPRDGHYGSRSSLSTTPRTPGRAYSMNRLDQLAQPIRRNGEHIRAIVERERRERELEMLDETASLGGGRRVNSGRGKRAGSAGPGGGASGSSSAGIMSRSMTHLAGTGNHGGNRGKYSLGGGISTNFRPLGNSNRDSSKSMTYISNNWSSTPTTPPPTQRSNLGLQTAATKKYLQSSFASSASATKRGQQHYSSTNPYRFDPNSLLLMNSSSLLVNAGSRSGNVTPGGHITSRPGSAMSTSTAMSSSGFVARRSVPAQRKPRPASIAGTVVSLEEINKLKRDSKPPVKTTTASASSSAQTTPKRTSNLMSTSMIVTSSSRLSSAEKKTPSKREPPVPKAASASKTLSKTISSERINKLSKDVKPKEVAASMAKSMIVSSTTSTNIETESNVSNMASNTPAQPKVVEKAAATAPAPVPAQSKEEKDALNFVKTEEEALHNIEQQQQQEHPQQQLKQEAEQRERSSLKTVAAIDANVVEKKADEGVEKIDNEPEVLKKPRSKENSVVRELTPPTQTSDGNDLMTASMIARKITTEEEAKAALAERRKKAREEAERQAELERQRVEAERLAEIKRQEEEAERQRLFEEEAMRLAEEQRRGEEERLRKAIEEAQQREEEERLKREEEEKQRIEREEAEKKAKEEAEKQRIEVAERLKREEKEREERRKRVEAIMSRTRKGNAAAAATPNSTSTKATNDSEKVENTTQNQTEAETPTSNNGGGSSTSTSGSSSSAATTPTPIPVQTAVTTTVTSTVADNSAVNEPQNSQAMYEQSVVDKENSLINSFSNMIIDENAKNLQQIEVSNGKLHADFSNSDSILQNTTTTTVTNTTVANGNGHIENVNNKNDINILQDVVAPATNQLIDLSIESQDLNNPLNFNNNNSLLTTTTTLVTADSHENKDISLL